MAVGSSKPGHVAAPFQGVVTTVLAEGDPVNAGALVCVLALMAATASCAKDDSGGGAAGAGEERSPASG